jgi:hypothetical protein
MLRPIPSKSAAILAKTRAETQPLEGDEAVSENAEKLKLATALHAQGINPERWTEARPAGWAAQKAFQETGRKPDAQHFEVDGRLYKTDPRVAATQAQGQDAIDVYLGAAPKPVEQLVDIAKVPLKYPFGRPHEARDDRPDAHALNLHYARVGVDPGSAHNGDPLPMDQQPKLQQATRAPDGSEIPLGIHGIYRGYDDGFFYAANEGTVESPDVQALRRKLAAEKAAAQGDVALMVANDNDPEIDEAVARSYAKQAPATSSTESLAAGNTLVQQSAETAGRLPQLISAIGKLQNGESLTADDSDLLARTEAAFAKAGIPIDLKKVDVKHLKQTVERAGNASDSVDNLNASAVESTSPAIAGATLAVPAGGAALTGLRTVATTVGALLEEAAVGTAALGAAAFTGLVGGFLALMTSSTQGPEADESPSLNQKSAQNGEVGPNEDITSSDQGQSLERRVTTDSSAASTSMPLVQPFTAPADFKPDSKDMWDAQKDFAHALLQGQLPEIWINGQQITFRNQYGSRGKPIVQQLDKSAVKAIEKALEECPDIHDVKHVGGGDRAQMHIKDPDSIGNLNSARPDITFKFQHGDFNCQYHINTADTKIDGSLNAREGRNATRLMSNIEKIVRAFAAAINNGIKIHDPIGEAGHAFNHMPKPKTDSEDEVNQIIEKFMEEVFSCSEITRECERTAPEKK